MKKRTLAFSLIGTLLFAQCKTSTPPQTASTATQSATEAPAKKELTYTTVPNDPLKTRIYTLDNGLKVYLSQYKAAPRIQTYIAVRAGSKNDPANATGLAHYLEHMAFKGSTRLGTIDWEKEKVELAKIEALYELYRTQKDPALRQKTYHQIDSISGVAAKYAVPNEYDKLVAAMGMKNSNASTWVEQTIYYGDIPSNQLDKWAMLEAERLGVMIPRLFHTELEAVYEEKNRSLDSDNNKAFEAAFAALFPTHQYGTQTTIGTVEHLKNPSITEIKKYFDQYYVPNNMAIAMSGDLEFDQTIQVIQEHFGRWQKKNDPVYRAPQEKPIAAPVVKEVFGPEAESLLLAYRFSGVKSKDAIVLRMINQILSNGQAGLIDLNINQKQAALGAGSFAEIYNDYSAHFLSGNPRQGQTLDQVRDLLLQQVELVKKGQFEDWLIPAIVNKNKISKMKSYESNAARATAFVDAFLAHMDWSEYLQQEEAFEKITKQDVMDVANRYYSNNYVAIYKRTGQDPTAQKVEKPAITPVPANREAQSEYYKLVASKPASDLQPQFVDYQKDLQEGKLKSGIPIYYTRNAENGLFNLYYVLEMGTNNDPKIGLAVDYLQYLGTDKYTAEELQKEFFKIGCSFSVSSGQDQVYVSLSGLDENLEQGLTLFESLLQNPKADKKALEDLVAGILKDRKDAKLNKNVIHSVAMVNYAKYGPKNPFTNILSEPQLKKVKPEELLSIIKSIPTYQHHVLYYGPRPMQDVTATLNTGHNAPASLKPIPAAKEFKELDITKRQVLWTDYNMVQAELLFLTKSLNYDPKMVPTIRLYNEYFDGGMGAIVFQELRESRALAYSASSRFNNASRKDRANYIMSYIGTQADKLPEAMAGMQELLNDMPLAATNFENAKASVRNSIATERVNKVGILMNYEQARKLGVDHDIRKDIYESLDALTLDQIKAFQQQFVKGQNQTILVIGSKDRLNFKELAKYGTVKQLTLKELFGY
ncbi:M16 family metallopeptidase [Rufibacter quisquiliarum]|uniref:Putative Zn-dependent peptidase n=1 Tax=Rufibacter quisquiliarum TaxID=1549639 RepID=A0A839GXQ4_9BACT|nr:M16 family metallopeptidase [Rufibacter quisquiliarum]MBA9079617.1 putative Zn-dependent peptidase [Rufibacter quisquiliarum]